MIRSSLGLGLGGGSGVGRGGGSPDSDNSDDTYKTPWDDPIILAYSRAQPKAQHAQTARLRLVSQFLLGFFFFRQNIIKTNIPFARRFPYRCIGTQQREHFFQPKPFARKHDHSDSPRLQFLHQDMYQNSHMCAYSEIFFARQLLEDKRVFKRCIWTLRRQRHNAGCETAMLICSSLSTAFNRKTPPRVSHHAERNQLLYFCESTSPCTVISPTQIRDWCSSMRGDKLWGRSENNANLQQCFKYIFRHKCITKRKTNPKPKLSEAAKPEFLKNQKLCFSQRPSALTTRTAFITEFLSPRSWKNSVTLQKGTIPTLFSFFINVMLTQEAPFWEINSSCSWMKQIIHSKQIKISGIVFFGHCQRPERPPLADMLDF